MNPKTTVSLVTPPDSTLSWRGCSGIDLLEKIDQFWTPFSLRFTVTIDIFYLTLIWLDLFYRMKEFRAP